MKLSNIPIDQLHVSKLNMRHGRKRPDIDDIYPSVRDDGVFQTLLVRKEGKTYGVIAGRRRLFALRKLAKETGKTPTAPCGIMDKGDDPRALEASLLENIARLPAGEFQQYDAFARLAAGGKSPDDIAETFGVTPLKVRRILALANLKPEIKALYEDEKIAVPTLRAMTLASEEQQDMWLTLFNSEEEYAPEGERLKAWLTGGARIKIDTAIFEIDTYDGTVITDLFNETGYFADPDLFWTYQSAAIAERVDAYQADGWPEIVIMDRGDHFSKWEYGVRGKDAGGKVFVEIKHDGAVTFHEGFLTNADIKKIDTVLNGNADRDSDVAKTTKPELSGPLTDYIALHRHAAIRSSLIDHPNIALRLSVAHMLTGSDLWSVEPQDTTVRKEATTQSVAKSLGAMRMDAERNAVFDLLGITEHKPDYGRVHKLSDGDLPTVFATLLKLDDETVLRVLTLAMASSLAVGSTAVEALTHTIDVDMAALWTPDDSFFDLVRDKRVLNAMVSELAGAAAAKAHLTDTGKVQKEIITNRIAGKGCEPDRDWRPRWMRLHPTSYLKGTANPFERLNKAAKAIITPDKKKSKKAA